MSAGPVGQVFLPVRGGYLWGYLPVGGGQPFGAPLLGADRYVRPVPRAGAPPASQPLQVGEAAVQPRLLPVVRDDDVVERLGPAVRRHELLERADEP